MRFNLTNTRFVPRTDGLVARRQRAELRVENETHGEQVTVKHHPEEHVDGENERFDQVEEGPDGRQVEQGRRHREPQVVNGQPVLLDGAVHAGDGHVTVHVVRGHYPDEQGDVADHGKRAEQQRQRATALV